MSDPIADVKRVIDDAAPRMFDGLGPLVAQLADEDDEHGAVVITTEAGHLVMAMPRATYEALAAKGKA